ncbi:beta-propeller fold lactonase family protein [Rhodococcus sp. NPDC003322]
MSNEKHLAYIGELAVTLGIGLAVAAPVGVAAAAPADNDSGTSSSVGSSDGASANSRHSDGTSSRDSDRGASNGSASHGSNNNSDNGNSDSDGPRSSGPRSSRTDPTPPTDESTTNDTPSEATSGDDAGETRAPDPATTTDGTESTGADSTATEPAAVDDSGTETAPTGRPAVPEGTSGENSSAPTATAGPTIPDGADTGDRVVTGNTVTDNNTVTDYADTDNADTDNAGGPTPVTAPRPDSTTPDPAATTADAATHGPGPDTSSVVPGPALPGTAAPGSATPGSAEAKALPGLPGVPGVASATLDPATRTAALLQRAHEDVAAGTQALAAALPDLPTPAEAASRVVSGVLGAIGLRPYLSDDPSTPIESPAFWALAAGWCRRQEMTATADATRGLASGGGVTTGQPIEPADDLAASTVAETSTLTGPAVGTATARTLASSEFTTSQATGSSADLAVSTLAATSTATGLVVGAPDRGTGKVLGSINASGSGLVYTVTDQPDRGSVKVDSATGSFTYTPTNAARQTAALDPAGDYDSFTVTATSGQTSTPVIVQVPVSAARMQVAQSITVGSNPSGAAIAGTKTYVANKGSKSVSVISANNAVGGPITVGTSPTGVAADPGGTRVYVTNSGSNNVSVINTGTDKVVATVTVRTTPTAVAVNPVAVTKGTNRVYVVNSGSNNVSVINSSTSTSTNTVVTTINVGTTPNAVAVNPSGTRAYVTNAGSLLVPGSVSVIDTTSNTVVATVRTGIGTTPNAVAVSPDGTRVYVANRGSNDISVIDTNNNTVVGRISVSSQPTSVVVTSDGSAVYAVSDSDKLTVIDPKTNTVVSSVGIDSPAESGAHSIALSSDGSRMLVTDAADGRVRALSLTQVNSAPTATLTVADPRLSDGAVFVTLTPTDPDGDPVTFTYTAPNSGAVASDGVAALTYTPTAAARDLALQSQGADADQFTLTFSDGQAATNLVVTVPVSETPSAVSFDADSVDSTAIRVGSGPYDAAIVGGRLYVVSDDDSVRVFDRTTGTVVGDPIAVDWYSTTIAAAPRIDRVYVNSPMSGTVQVIDTATGTVAATIQLPVSEDFQGYSLSQAMVTSLDGTHLYTSGQDGTVSVIDTATNKVVASQPLGSFSSLEISADGRYLYGTSGPAVSVIDSRSLTTIATTTVGPEWNLNATSSEFGDTVYSMAVDPSGTRLYATYRVTTVATGTGGHTNGEFISDTTGRSWLVTGRYDVVTVIDIDPASASYGEEIATVRLTDGARDVALSSDGRVAYVTAGDGRTVTVIDTVTNTLVGTFVTDPTGSASTRSVLISGDTLYVTDYYDGAVYAVTGLPTGTPAALAV